RARCADYLPSTNQAWAASRKPQRGYSLVAGARSQHRETVVRLQELREVREERYPFGNSQRRAAALYYRVECIVGRHVQVLGSALDAEQQVRLAIRQWNAVQWREVIDDTRIEPLDCRQAATLDQRQ